MRDEELKLGEILHHLRALQQSYDKIRDIKGRLQTMVDSDIDSLLTSSHFEATLASHVHPHMHSFPYPLGNRFSDVEDLITPLAEKVHSETESGKSSDQENCRNYLENILPVFRNGYGLCLGGSYSPANSGMNIDPRTFTFRTKAQDRLRYFPHNEEFPSPKAEPTDSTPTQDSCYTHREVECNSYTANEGESGRESATPTLGGESMICNYPASEYTDVFLREISEDSSPVPPMPPIPTGTDDFGYVKKHSVTFSIPDSPSETGSTNISVRDSIICNPPSPYPMSVNSKDDVMSVYPISNASSSRTNDESSQTNDELVSNEESSQSVILNKRTKLYTPAKSKLRDETWDIMKAESVKNIVVTQTWLTGWIRELYILDDVINKRSVENELKKG